MAIFWRIMKDRRVLLVVYTFFGVAVLLMYIALFPSFSKQTASLEQVMKSYPESFMKAFNFDIKSFNTIEGYLSTEQFSFMWPLLVILMSIGFASTCFAAEIEKGTIEILLSQPVSRLKIFISRYLAGLTNILIFTFMSIYAVIPLCRAFNIPYNSENIFKLILLALLFAWAIYSIGIMASAIVSDRGKVYFISGVTLVIMYVLNIVSSIKDQLADFKYLSFFYYFNASKALVRGDIDQWSYLVFGSVIIFCTIFGAIYFIKRDAAN